MPGYQRMPAQAMAPAPPPVAGIFSAAASLLLLLVGIAYVAAVLLPADQLTGVEWARRAADASAALVRVGSCMLLLGLAPGVIGLVRHEVPRLPSILGTALGALGGLLALAGYLGELLTASP